MNMIETSNAMCAFLPRSLAPVAAGYQGGALPIGGAALEPIGRTWKRTTDPRTHRIRIPMT